jgi:hypothetical protein
MMNLTLTHALPYAVKFMALAAFLFAMMKVFIVADTFGVLVALVFAGLHLPLCLFSCLVVLWFYDHYPAAGFLALASSLLNALLI